MSVRLVMGVVTAALVTAGVTDNSNDAAMFRGGPDHTGVYAAQSSPTLGRVVWKHRTGGRVISSPLPVKVEIRSAG